MTQIASFIEENPEILGGTPVIKGTRVTVYAIANRLDFGETREAIREDYPEFTDEIIDAAVAYAGAHPLVETPGGKPWLKV